MFLKANQRDKIVIIALLFASLSAFSQGDPLSLDDVPVERVFIKEAFNGPQIIYSQSTNMLKKNDLDLVFGHRFGKLDEGAFGAFGLDQAYIRIGVEYGITDFLAAGLGRSSLAKTVDGFLKYRPLVQGGPKNIPVSAVVLLNTSFSLDELQKQNEIHEDNQFVNQLVYTMQSSVSRKFSSLFSIQLSGSLVHQNTVSDSTYSNNVYGLGGGARLKLSERIHLVAEYTHTFENPDNIKDPYSFGADIVAGGHVFTLFFGNGAGIIEQFALTGNTDNDLRFGFSIRRSFKLGKPKVD